MKQKSLMIMVLALVYSSNVHCSDGLPRRIGISLKDYSEDMKLPKQEFNAKRSQHGANFEKFLKDNEGHDNYHALLNNEEVRLNQLKEAIDSEIKQSTLGAEEAANVKTNAAQAKEDIKYMLDKIGDIRGKAYFNSLMRMADRMELKHRQEFSDLFNDPDYKDILQRCGIDPENFILPNKPGFLFIEHDVTEKEIAKLQKFFERAKAFFDVPLIKTYADTTARLSQNVEEYERLRNKVISMKKVHKSAFVVAGILGCAAIGIALVTALTAKKHEISKQSMEIMASVSAFLALASSSLAVSAGLSEQGVYDEFNPEEEAHSPRGKVSAAIAKLEAEYAPGVRERINSTATGAYNRLKELFTSSKPMVS